MITVLLLAIAACISGSGPAKADVPAYRIAHVWLNISEPGAGAQSQYLGFMDSIRRAAGHPYRNGIYLTGSQSTINLMRVDLNAGNTTLRLWITPGDMYLRGFTTQAGATYYFNDFNLRQRFFELSDSPDAGLLPLPLSNVNELPFGGNYISLEGATNRNRLHMPISFNDLWNSLFNLAYAQGSTSGQDLARSLLFMIQYVSEASRLTDLNGTMSAIMLNRATHYAGLTEAHAEVENHWTQISEFLIAFTNGSNPPPVDSGPHAGWVRNINDVQRYVLLGKNR
ncbi:ribosome-inactivating family protein [Streptomyces sp. yr375]|uniref:ribosome-inactivating family protein n=1 Tax=Streptomyces sp. yr375 TaxID=1761906 RepID=UPI0015A560A9|nr:ribosome-inactivating family protein [Streptomyces sp. yr375]